MKPEVKGLIDAVLGNAHVVGPDDMVIRWTWEGDRLITNVDIKDEREELAKIRARIVEKVGAHAEDSPHTTSYLLTLLIGMLDKAEAYMNTKHKEWEREGWGKLQKALMHANQQLTYRAMAEEYRRGQVERLLELMTPHIEPHKLLSVMMKLNSEIPLYTEEVSQTPNDDDEVDEPA